MTTTSDLVLWIREQSGLSWRDLATTTGISPQTLSTYLGDVHPRPRYLHRLHNLAQHLETLTDHPVNTRHQMITDDHTLTERLANEQPTQPLRNYKPEHPDIKPLPGTCGYRTQNRTCHLPAGHKTDHPGYGHCSKHHGSNTNSRKHAATLRMLDLVQDRRRQALFYQIDLPTITPEEALLEEVRRSAGIVRWLQERIQAWDLSGITEPVRARIAENTGLPELNQQVWSDVTSSVVVAESEVLGWLRVYLLERKHLVACSKAAIDAGVAERLVRVAEGQASVIAEVLRSALRDMGVEMTPERWAVVGRTLRAVGAEQG